MDGDTTPTPIVPLPEGKGRPPLYYRLRSIYRAFTTKKGLIGTYNYSFLFTPNIPFVTSKTMAATVPPFFGINDNIPVLLALILGLQHALAMFVGPVVASMLLSGSSGANLLAEQQQYLVSTALIISGILSIIQITRLRIFRTPYYIGTGLVSVLGISLTIVPIAHGAFAQFYSDGTCPLDADGNKLPCPDGYGAIIGTCACGALTQVLISFLPPKVMQRLFPPIVTGPTLMMIGILLIENGFRSWAGGTGPCSDDDPADFFKLCPNINAPNALPWGSAEYLGLGFSVFLAIILCERFGSPIMKSTAVIWGLLVGSIIAGATGYFDLSSVAAAPVASFAWVETFKMTVYGPIVLPTMIVFIINTCEAIGDITASCDVSRVELEGPAYESRVQGGVLADGMGSVFAALMTITCVTTYSQNNGIIALTRCANRKAGYACCFFLILMGVFAKFAAVLISIPSPVMGGMTTFLFCSVAVSGMAVVIRGVAFTRRNRFILTASLAIGCGAILVPSFFNNVFTYSGDNTVLQGFLDSIVFMMKAGFPVTAFLAMILNLVLEEAVEDENPTDGRRPIEA